MKVIATCNTADQANMLRSHLEGSGISTYLRDEEVISIDRRLSSAVGGVKVEVPDEDFDRATSLIADFYTDQVSRKIEENKKKHKFPRYVKIGLMVSLLVFVFIVFRRQSMDGLVVAAVPSLMLGGLVGLCCGSLDI